MENENINIGIIAYRNKNGMFKKASPIKRKRCKQLTKNEQKQFNEIISYLAQRYREMKKGNKYEQNYKV